MTEEKKYNIHINPKKPSKEDIRKKMDFEGAYKSYTHWIYRTPWHRFQRHASKNRKTTMMIFLLLIVALVFVLESEEQNDHQHHPGAPIEQIDSLNKKIIIKEH